MEANGEDGRLSVCVNSQCVGGTCCAAWRNTLKKRLQPAQGKDTGACFMKSKEPVEPFQVALHRAGGVVRGLHGGGEAATPHRQRFDRRHLSSPARLSHHHLYTFPTRWIVTRRQRSGASVIPVENHMAVPPGKQYYRDTEWLGKLDVLLPESSDTATPGCATRLHECSPSFKRSMENDNRTNGGVSQLWCQRGNSVLVPAW